MTEEKTKNFKPYPDKEDYLELEDYILNPYYEEEIYKELEDDIVDCDDLEGLVAPLKSFPINCYHTSVSLLPEEDWSEE